MNEHNLPELLISLRLLGATLRLSYVETTDITVLDESISILLEVLGLSVGNSYERNLISRELYSAYYTLFSTTYDTEYIKLSI